MSYNFPSIFLPYLGETDGTIVGASSRDSARAKTVKESTGMAEKPTVVSQGEPVVSHGEPRMAGLQFGEPKPSLPHMDPSTFHVEDNLQDLFTSGPIKEPARAAATIFEPIVVAIVLEPTSTYELGPRPSDLIQEVPKASELEPMFTEESGVLEPVLAEKLCLK